MKEPIYIYENGKVTLTTPNYIDEAKSNYKDTKKIYIALRRVSANHRYLIQVTDKGGNDPELIRNKLFFVKKGKASKKSTKSTKPKDAKAQNTNNTNTNGTAPDNTVDQNTVNNANKNEMASNNTVDPNAVNNSNTNGAATENTVDQNTVNSTNKNETKTEEMEKPKLTWNDDKKQLTVEIKEKSAKIKKVDLGNLKKYFTKVKKSSNDYKWVYNTTELAKDKKNYKVTVTYENGKTEKSNKVTVKMEDRKPTISYSNKKIIVKDKDGIKSAKITAWSSYFEKGTLSKDGKTMTFKMKKETSKKIKVKVKITDKYDRSKNKTKWVPKTKKTTSGTKSSSSSSTKTTSSTKSSSSSSTKTASSTKSSSSSSTKTTSSTKSSNSKPTISWNGHTKILTITAPSQIRKVEFNTQSIRNKFSVQHSSGSKWTYKLKKDTEIDSNVMCKVSYYGKRPTTWTNSKYIKVTQIVKQKPTIKLTNKGTKLSITSDTDILKITIKRNILAVIGQCGKQGKTWSRSISSFKQSKTTRG